MDAISATDIWAAGTYGDQPPTPLLEHWDGTAWSMVDGPPLGGFRNLLYGVSAVSSDDVWAAGEHDPDSFSYRPLALHWDGSSWSEVRAKSPGVNASFLDVVASSSQDVWGVGAYYDVGTVLKPLTEHTGGCG